MTKSVIFDSFALIAYFRNETGTDYISELFSELALGNLEGYVSTINVGEVYYMIHRKSNATSAEKALEIIQTLPVEIVDADWAATYEAAKLKSKYRISYADAFAAALTIQMKGTLVTGDNEFNSLKKESGFKVHFINPS
jgi:predicted nucleic acid-binding protein